MPAVGLWTEGGFERVTYVPTVADLRTSGFRLMHLDCFAQRHGVAALEELKHQHDRREDS